MKTKLPVVFAASALALLAATLTSLAPVPERLLPEDGEAIEARYVDRRGELLSVTYENAWNLHDRVPLHQMPRILTEAFVAAEDKRFFNHHGVDWWAVGRASWQWLVARRVVSGASTLTQQLARSTFARERTLWGKWKEMVVARCIERHLSKAQILEAYVNRIEFGPNVVGIGAAADAYFAKPLSGFIDRVEVAFLHKLVPGSTSLAPAIGQGLSIPHTFSLV